MPSINSALAGDRSRVILAVRLQHKHIAHANMLDSGHALQHVIAVLAEHDIEIYEGDIKEAFDASNPRRVVTEWAHEHLGPETLLSKEEEAL